MHEYFEEWLKQQEDYKTLVFQHGDQVFVREDGEYKILAVRLGFQVWSVKTKAIAALINLRECKTIAELMCQRVRAEAEWIKCLRSGDIPEADKSNTWILEEGEKVLSCNQVT